MLIACVYHERSHSAARCRRGSDWNCKVGVSRLVRQEESAVRAQIGGDYAWRSSTNRHLVCGGIACVRGELVRSDGIAVRGRIRGFIEAILEEEMASVHGATSLRRAEPGGGLSGSGAAAGTRSVNRRQFCKQVSLKAPSTVIRTVNSRRWESFQGPM